MVPPCPEVLWSWPPPAVFHAWSLPPAEDAGSRECDRMVVLVGVFGSISIVTNDYKLSGSNNTLISSGCP